jgi:hypothetical protein
MSRFSKTGSSSSPSTSEMLAALLGRGGGGRRGGGDGDDDDSGISGAANLALLRMLANSLGGGRSAEVKERFTEAEAKDVIFVKFSTNMETNKETPALAAITKVEKDEDGDKIATCRIIGSDCYSRPTMPVEKIPTVQFGSANVSPTLKDVPAIDKDAIRSRELQRRQARIKPNPPPLSSYRQEDEDIMYRVARNVVIKHIETDAADNHYSWACKWDSGLYAKTPQSVEDVNDNIFHAIRTRINAQDLPGTGFRLSYFGPCTRRARHMAFIIEEVPLEMN